MYCICIYINHNRNIETTDLDKLFNTLDLRNNHFIIGGDFNCRHPFLNDNNTNQFGTRFINWFLSNDAEHNISILKSNTPTYKNISFLDFFLVNSKLFNFQNQIKTYNTFSDHNAIETIADFNNTPYKIMLEEPQTFYNYSIVPWKTFRKNIVINSINLKIPNNRNITNTEIESSLDSINAIISSAMSSSIPKTTTRNWGNLNLPYSITKMIKDKNKLRKKLHRIAANNFHIANNIQSQLKAQIKQLTTVIKENINTHFNNKLVSKLENVRVNNNPYVELNKFLKTGSNTIPHITDNNNITTNDISALNTLGEQFEKAHSQNTHLGDDDFSSDINHWVDNFINIPIDTIANFTNLSLANRLRQANR